MKWVPSFYTMQNKSACIYYFKNSEGLLSGVDLNLCFKLFAPVDFPGCEVMLIVKLFIILLILFQIRIIHLKIFIKIINIR